MSRYRKKPVVVEAVAWNGKYSDGTEWPNWFRHAMASEHICEFADRALCINTLEGFMRAEIGDMVICGVKGELYPCKPDIFAATYESASDGGKR